MAAVGVHPQKEQGRDCIFDHLLPLKLLPLLERRKKSAARTAFTEIFPKIFVRGNFSRVSPTRVLFLRGWRLCM